MNVPMPQDLLARTHLINSAAYQANLGALAGHVLYVRKVSGQCPEAFANEYSGLDLSIETYVRNGEELKPAPAATPRYESKIDRGVTGSASFSPAIASIAANLSESQAADVLVSDVYLLVRDDQVDLTKLQALANTPLPTDVCARLFVRGAALETYVYKDYVSVAADATTSGTAFGGNGKVYSTTSQYAQAFGIGLDLQRLSQAAQLMVVEAAVQLPSTIRVPDAGFHRR
jgi:hypothetical protein